MNLLFIAIAISNCSINFASFGAAAQIPNAGSTTVAGQLGQFGARFPSSQLYLGTGRVPRELGVGVAGRLRALTTSERTVVDVAREEPRGDGSLTASRASLKFKATAMVPTREAFFISICSLFS